MTTNEMTLAVLLGDMPVGTIRSDSSGRTEFLFRADYLGASERPILGQFFEDHLDEVQRSRVHLPPFFSNLLPEGGLRELVAKSSGIHPDREAHLIAALGEDLPGAVVIRPISDLSGDGGEAPILTDEGEALKEDKAFRFSLAGAQLKFSVLYDGTARGPTVPVGGKGGDWIAKLPSETYERLPENEFAIARWASRVGIQVPEVRLVRAGDIEGLPVEIDGDRQVFMSRRFDRPSGGARIHQEDFAQVRNLRRQERYGGLGHASIAAIVRSVAGEDDFDEFVRRTVFNILIGNGDAHLKNWSLTYPNRIGARLSPAYDLVAVVTYLPGDGLALKLSRESEFSKIRLSHFERLADKTGVPQDRVGRIVRETVKRTMDTLPKDIEAEWARETQLRAHIERLALVVDAG